MALERRTLTKVNGGLSRATLLAMLTRSTNYKYIREVLVVVVVGGQITSKQYTALQVGQLGSRAGCSERQISR